MYTELKKKVFEANMELHNRHLVLYTWGNVSQVDRERGVVVIKPSGVPYETMKWEDMVVLRLSDGEKVDGALKPSSDAPTHLCLYRAFPEIGGITHTHSRCATAFAQAHRSIPCLGTTHADYFRGDVPVTRYLTKEEIDRGYEYCTGEVIVEAFEGLNPVHTPAALVRGHGPFAWGKDAAESVYHAAVLEEVAAMAIHTFALTPDIASLDENTADKHFMRKHGPNAYYGQK